MTIDEIEASSKTVLTPSDVAGLLGCGPYAINVQANADPAKLGFPVALIGRRVKIPKDGFIKWYKGQK